MKGGWLLAHISPHADLEAHGMSLTEHMEPCMQMMPTSLEQALMVAKGAAQAHAEDDREAEAEAEWEEDAKREEDGTREHEKEREGEETPAKKQDSGSYTR